MLAQPKNGEVDLFWWDAILVLKDDNGREVSPRVECRCMMVGADEEGHRINVDRPVDLTINETGPGCNVHVLLKECGKMICWFPVPNLTHSTLGHTVELRPGKENNADSQSI